jgi:hypothetical protein
MVKGPKRILAKTIGERSVKNFRGLLTIIVDCYISYVT